jgi:hypothetical protein
MFIQVDHEDGRSALKGVADVFDGMRTGDSVTVTGMKMGERTIHIEVVKALIHVSREITGLNVRVVESDDVTGWGRELICIITGVA